MNNLNNLELTITDKSIVEALERIAQAAHEAHFKDMYLEDGQLNWIRVVQHTINMAEIAQGRDETRWRRTP